MVEPIQVASDQRYKLGPLDARETVEFVCSSSESDCFVCDTVPIFLRKCNLSRSSVLTWLQVTTQNLHTSHTYADQAVLSAVYFDIFTATLLKCRFKAIVLGTLDVFQVGLF